MSAKNTVALFQYLLQPPPRAPSHLSLSSGQGHRQMPAKQSLEHNETFCVAHNMLKDYSISPMWLLNWWNPSGSDPWTQSSCAQRMILRMEQRKVHPPRMRMGHSPLATFVCLEWHAVAGSRAWSMGYVGWCIPWSNANVFHQRIWLGMLNEFRLIRREDAALLTA